MTLFTNRLKFLNGQNPSCSFLTNFTVTKPYTIKQCARRE